MRREKYRWETITPGHQHNARMSLISLIRPLIGGVIVYRDVSPTSQIRAEVRMKSSHSIWAKYREAGKVIDLDGLFSEYWSSNSRKFTVLSWSLLPTVRTHL